MRFFFSMYTHCKHHDKDTWSGLTKLANNNITIMLVFLNKDLLSYKAPLLLYLLVETHYHFVMLRYIVGLCQHNYSNVISINFVYIFRFYILVLNLECVCSMLFDAYYETLHNIKVTVKLKAYHFLHIWGSSWNVYA